MVIIIMKCLFLAGFMLASVLASETPTPLMAALQVQSNFDFGLTRKEFRVHYSGLGFQSSEAVSIKIYKKNEQTETDPVLSFDVPNDQKNTRKAYYFALGSVEDGTYEVEVCAGQVCSRRSPSLTDVTTPAMKLTCKQVEHKEGKWVSASSEPTFSLDFVGPKASDWLDVHEFAQIEQNVNQARGSAGLSTDYETDFTKYRFGTNPAYKKAEQKFYAAVKYSVVQYKKLFEQFKGKGNPEIGKIYTEEFCERKYLLSANAHVVDTTNNEVVQRLKTTLFLSEGGKKMFVFGKQDAKVHVEMTHDGVAIPTGEYEIRVSFCATEKDLVESTFCADPIVKPLTVQ